MDEIVNQRKKKKKMMWIIALVAIGVIVVYMVLRPKDDGTDAEQFKKEEKVRRDIVSSVSGTGVIKAAKSQEVSSSLTGVEITNVYVSEGDEVKKGDKLIAFDVSDIKERRKNTQDSLNDAIESRQDTIDDQVEQDDRYDREMEERYDEYHLDLEVAKENMVTANETYDSAKRDLEDYQKLYNETDFSVMPDETKSQMDQTLTAKKQTLESARSSKNSARQSYETLLNSDDNSLPDAKKNYDEMAENSIETYDELIDNYNDTLEDIDEQLLDTVIVAPADGTVTEVYVDFTDFLFTLIIIL